MTRLTGTLLGDDDQSQAGRIHKRQIPKVNRDEFVDRSAFASASAIDAVLRSSSPRSTSMIPLVIRLDCTENVASPSCGFPRLTSLLPDSSSPHRLGASAPRNPTGR